MNLIAKKRRAVLLLLAGLAAAVALVVGGCGGDKGTGPSGGEDTTYTLTVNRDPADGGTTLPARSQSNIRAGAEISITAVADDGYTFDYWTVTSGNGAIADEYSASTYITVNGNVTVTAYFTENGGGGGTLFYDGQTYRTVKIGGQRWMAENLNYATVGGSWCYDDDESNCDMYGALYDWQTAMSVCPTGWHLPTRAEWDTLAQMGGGKWFAGDKLKTTSGWNGSTTSSNWSRNGTDEYGFSALPSGYRNSDGSFGYVGLSGLWWTAEEYSGGGAYSWGIDHFNPGLHEGNGSVSDGFSVRCVGD